LHNLWDENNIILTTKALEFAEEERSSFPVNQGKRDRLDHGPRKLFPPLGKYHEKVNTF
jgi:hypothetical protein